MHPAATRRTFLCGAATLPFWIGGAAFGAGNSSVNATMQLQQLETQLGGRLGVFALNTGNGAMLGYRDSERFPVCSTFKIFAAAALLARSADAPGLLQRRVHYQSSDLVHYSPITQKNLASGMTMTELCAAALQYSDNTAANLIIKMLGGTGAVTAFARSIGDHEFRLDRWETELNTAIPGDARDTSTPRAMGRSLQRLTLGDALPTLQRDVLCRWLTGNTTGNARIRAALPPHWRCGDKTGSGDYGTANDIAVIWPPDRAPLIIAVYTTRRQQDAKYRDDIIASATRIALSTL